MTAIVDIRSKCLQSLIVLQDISYKLRRIRYPDDFRLKTAADLYSVGVWVLTQIPDEAKEASNLSDFDISSLFGTDKELCVRNLADKLDRKMIDAFIYLCYKISHEKLEESTRSLDIETIRAMQNSMVDAIQVMVDNKDGFTLEDLRELLKKGFMVDDNTIQELYRVDDTEAFSVMIDTYIGSLELLLEVKGGAGDSDPNSNSGEVPIAQA